MESVIYSALVNLGGMGVLAAVLLFLHLSALRTIQSERDLFRTDQSKGRDVFAAELRAERDQCRVEHEQIMKMQLDHHEKTMSAIMSRR